MKLISSGTASARMITRMHILLESGNSTDESQWKYEKIGKAYYINSVTLMDVRNRFVEDGLKAVLAPKDAPVKVWRLDECQQLEIVYVDDSD